MKLRVRSKLLLLVVIPVLAALGIAALGVNSLLTVTQTATQLTEDRVIPVWRLSRIARHYTQNVVDLAHKTRAQMLFWHEAEGVLNNASALIDREWKVYLEGPLTETERTILNRYPNAIEQAHQSIQKLQGYIDEQSSYSIGNYVDLELYLEIDPVLGLIDELVQAQEQLAKEAGDRAQQVADAGVQRLVAAVIGTILFVVLLGWWLNAGITRRMDRMLSVITEIELHKDLSIRANLPQGDEFGDMGRRFDRMMAEIGQLIAQLQQMGVGMTDAATNLLKVNEQSKQQAVEQSQDIATVVDGMAQVHAATDVVLGNVEAADEVSRDAREKALTGDQTVQDTVAAINSVAQIVKSSASGMEQLRRDSDNIGSVLEVIKSIAEQTNLLALNAAIEAARAGEQGRGFAVVADEVRQLASRTSASTLEIQEIISNLQQGTQAASRQMLEGASATDLAVQQAQRAGVALVSLTEGFVTIGERSKAIKTACTQQRQLIDVAASGAERVDELAQQGASLASETLDSSRSVKQLASELGVKLKAFRV